MMKGYIEINGLRVFAHHGVMEQERVVGNMFEVTAHLVYPMDKAMEGDCLDGTMNYAEAIEIVMHEMSIPSSLLENVACRLKNALLYAFPEISGGMIRVAKLTPPVTAELDSVAVSIEW